jgi:hypothetical protein
VTVTPAPAPTESQHGWSQAKEMGFAKGSLAKGLCQVKDRLAQFCSILQHQNVTIPQSKIWVSDTDDNSQCVSPVPTTQVHIPQTGTLLICHFKYLLDCCPNLGL